MRKFDPRRFFPWLLFLLRILRTLLALTYLLNLNLNDLVVQSLLKGDSKGKMKDTKLFLKLSMVPKTVEQMYNVNKSGEFFLL